MKIVWYMPMASAAHGTALSDQGFPQDVVPWINDDLDPAWLIDVLQRGNVPPLIIMDHYAKIHGMSTDSMYLPLFLHKLVEMYDKNKHASDFTETRNCFNFTINKKILNRSLMLKLIEWFDLLQYSNYTWSGQGRETDMSPMLEEISDLLVPPDLLGFVCAPIEIPARFFPDKLVQIVDGHHRIKDPRKGRFSVDYWERWFNDLYASTAVSLIAEGVSTHHATLFTEKTLWSAMAQTFPIWVGGYGQADEWQKLGFDTFDDVIDHSYQYQPTLWQRCYMALENNLGILTDLELASSAREKNRSRLQANRDLAFSGVFWRDVTTKISAQPAALQQQIYHDLDIFMRANGPGIDK